MSKAAIDLPIDIKLPIGKLGANLEEIEEDLEDLDEDIDLEVETIRDNVSLNTVHSGLCPAGFPDTDNSDYINFE